ncbi:hypothetical protein N7G274_010317 [Stereocaulon virgatum]|uniref:Gag protein n=1 Tax=Stereocaulon virgatum TaxID=373712 RepID=A0ABR4A0P1_9LECA
MADASPRFPNWGYKNADNKTMCHAMIAMAGQMDAWIDCDRTVSRAELKKMTRAIADFAKQCVEEADSKLDRLLQGQLNDLAEKSKQKPSWANVASRRPPVYDATTPSRANNYHGATAKYPEILVKTNESETLVNRQRGNAELGAVVNRRIQELTMGPPARAIRILKSGDISITLDDDQQAKRLREDLSWIKGYGEGARVATISYGVIAHGIPTKALPARDGELQMDEAIKALKQRNDPYFGPTGLDIVHAKWLSKTAGKNEKASLILQLATPEQANYLQKQNLSIGQMITPKCNACGGPHTAFDKGCSEKKKDMQRRKENQYNTPREHPVPRKTTQAELDGQGFQLVKGRHRLHEQQAPQPSPP